VTGSRLTAAMYLGIAFVSGAAVGGFGSWHASHVIAESDDDRRPSSAEMKRRYLEEMTDRLKLSENQVSDVSRILDETRYRLRKANDKRRPEYTAIQDDQRRQIRDLLDPNQKLAYDDLREEWRERARQREFARRGSRPE
jgi:hypothetical protein